VSDPQLSLQTTPLTAWHIAHGAKMVPFAGFTMPVQYAAGVLAEHAAVRQRVGVFDITHMGEFAIAGPGAEAWLDGMVTNRVAGIAPGKVVYTALCRPGGGVLDDMLIYRLERERWLVVCNAVNRRKVGAWFTGHLSPDRTTLHDVSDQTALIAVQGPDSLRLIQRLASFASVSDAIAELSFYTALQVDIAGATWTVSRTGYTGEHGYEIYLPNVAALPLWEELLAKGEDLGVLPVGLAARDTLRFEMAYCLYGHELGEDITPLEAGIGWAVKLKKEQFIGREALQRQQATGVPRQLVGLRVDGRAIARAQTAVLARGRRIGQVTSGTFSPTLKRALALALVEKPLAEVPLQVEVRGKLIACSVVPHPFLAARVKGDPRAERNLPDWAGSD
jgi:aminomethyltransferase